MQSAKIKDRAGYLQSGSYNQVHTVVVTTLHATYLQYIIAGSGLGPRQAEFYDSTWFSRVDWYDKVTLGFDVLFCNEIELTRLLS